MEAGELSYANVGRHSIAYRHAGDGELLVLLHGFLCDSRCWRTQLTRLADQFRLVAWDAPGAGFSSDPPESFTVSEWAQTLAEFLDAIGIERAHFLGLSWGGMLAQEFYRLYPARVDHLVLADTYAGWRGSLPAEAVELRRARCYRDAFRPKDEVVGEWVPNEFFSNATAELAREMVEVVQDFHPLGFKLMAKSLADTDTSSGLGEIKSATLLLWGERDQRSPLSVARQFHAAIPNSKLDVIEEAGHVSNMERPDEFNASVRRFLSSGAT